MASNSVSKKPDDALAKLFHSPLDARIQHLVRILSTATGMDGTLCFLGYGLVFTSSQLQLLSELAPQSLTTSSKAKLLELAASCKTLGGLCSDVRTFMRLWSLLKIYIGMRATYLNPPKDGLLRTIAWSQLTAMGAYLVYENQVYLASKGVIKGIAPAAMGAKLRTAIWVFAGYIVLDYVRLWRVWQLQQQTPSTALAEKGAVAKREEENRAWYKSLIVDSSYFPLCFHWGVEGGSLPTKWADLVVGLLGTFAGFANFREAARVTA